MAIRSLLLALVAITVLGVIGEAATAQTELMGISERTAPLEAITASSIRLKTIEPAGWTSTSITLTEDTVFMDASDAILDVRGSDGEISEELLLKAFLPGDIVNVGELTREGKVVAQSVQLRRRAQ